MRYQNVGLAVSLLASISCGGGGKPVQIDPKVAPVASRWNGTLATPTELLGALQVRGQAWMGAAEGSSDRTQAYVEISNAAPGGEHPWQVHRGRCGSDQGVLGSADSYGLLKVGGNGRASSTAELPMALPKTGSYYVTVHASARNMSTIIACGNLAPPSR